MSIMHHQQMELGQLIDALAKCDPKVVVEYDFCLLVPGDVASYRGYYDQLAIGYGERAYENSPTVATLLAKLRAANGATFEGYKGGTYRMGPRTPVWVANWGSSGGTAVVGVDDSEYRVILRTAKVD